MSDGVFNIAKGRAYKLVEDNPNSLVVLLLKANEVDDTLIDHDDVQALLAATGNTEADFTNYGRKTGLSGTLTPDDTNNRVSIDVPDQVWFSAGGAVNNTMTKAILAVQTGADDSTLVPIAHYDYPATTTGSDLPLQFNSGGAYRAQ